VFSDADDMTEVIASHDGTTQPTSGVPNQNFYPCEIDDGTCSYLYVAWNTLIPGVSDGVQDMPAGLDWTAGEVESWLGANNTPMLVFFGTLDNMISSGLIDQFDNDISVDTSIGNVTAFRLKEGMERFMITDINNPAASAKAQSDIPVLGDWVSVDIGQEFNHAPGGCNFLYMDGHVEFIKFPGKWPVNRMMAYLQGL